MSADCNTFYFIIMLITSIWNLGIKALSIKREIQRGMTIKETLFINMLSAKKKKCYIFRKVNISQQVSLRDVQFSENEFNTLRTGLF